ncbi:MAG: ABC transporter permease subunit [Akkermansiaceae bacterium]|nr:ABC transporter permease subunit [Akkermansiaceae bacterium]
MKAGLRLWTGRRLVVLLALVLFGYCAVHLGPRVMVLGEGADRFSTIKKFLGAAFVPALVDQSPNMPEGAAPFLVRVGEGLVRTFRYAVVAMSLAVPLGIGLGFFGSSAWWPGSVDYGRPKLWRRVVRGGLRVLRWSCRGLIALMRSVHELIWAMFFLSAIGDAPVTACVALALPFAGTLGKVFSELVDEEGQEARSVLMAGGATPLQAFVGVLIPQAFPGLLTYALYRFECALRSSAVLGFIGIETLGLGIRRSFENLYFREVWTQLFVLIIVIVVVDRIGARLRARLNRGVARKQLAGELSEAALRRTAPRDWMMRGAGVFALLLVMLSWNVGAPLANGLTGVRQEERLARFVTKLTPVPARPADRLAGWEERREAWSENQGEVGAWAWALWKKPGAKALGNTVVIATAAVVLAGIGAALLLPLGTRALATAEPFGLMGVASGWRRRIRLWIGSVVRGFFVVARAVPEYVYAFLLVALLGPSAWPLVFALALHNVGILGRLWGEVAENERPEAAGQLARVGASRGQIYLAGLAPTSFNRFLLFFFYRWETCVREATILGMLGISSLGYHISISRNFLRYDQMLFYVLLGAAVIILGDVLSDVLRRRLRLSR